MKNKFKLTLKRILIIWIVIYMLLPSISTFVLASDDNVNLNTERAGNYVANFAINFYENWSSESYILENRKITSSGGTGDTSGVAAGEYIWPLKNITVNSGYGERWNTQHKGLDLAGNMGDEIMASNNGVIIELFNNCPNNFAKSQGSAIFSNCCGNCGRYGNHIAIDHKDGTVTMYAHCTEIMSDLKVGDTVSKGQIIATVGTTGQSTGNHLHFEFRLNGVCVDPTSHMSDSAGFASSSSSAKKIKRGEVKTEYDETVNEVNETDSIYKLNNKSWISFVYKNALFKSNNDIQILTNSASINNELFDDKNNISGVKDKATATDVLDVTTLMSEGKILPGDILFSEYTPQGSSTKMQEYLLYVGGSKVIYATQNPKASPSGALKYEYIQYYFDRIRRNLKEGHEDDPSFIMPKYGVTQVYRINTNIAENLSESDANLFFNGKGYYSKVEYQGIPSDIKLFETNINIFRWIFDAIAKLIEFLLNLIIYIIRMQIIGWANLFENLIQHIVLGVSGNNESAGWDAVFGTSATSASGERITVESIFFNQIPILDANFFGSNGDIYNAGGHQLTLSSGAKDEYNVVVMLRKNLRTIYIVIRNLSIALLLFVLIIVGIKMAITSIADKKAEMKKFLVAWVYAICVVLFIHFFMYLVFNINDILVGVCREWSLGAAESATSDMLATTTSTEELNLYDAIRIKAYAFNWREGVPATIIYIFLIYLTIRFLFIYLKRYLTIYILALSSSFMGVKYAIDRLMGKKTTSLNKWLKDFSFNVLLQTVHAFIYVIFMAIALSVSQKSLIGAVIAMVVLNFMLQADKIIIKIFGLDKAGSLAEVNNPESWAQLIRKFMPIYTISKGALGLTRGLFFGNRGIIRQIADLTTGADNLKDANKVWETRKYNLLGSLARGFDFIPSKIRNIKGIGKLAQAIDNHLPIKYYKNLGKGVSYETNKQTYANIKDYRKLRRQRFTRPIKTAVDLALGTATQVAAIATTIADPALGATMFIGARRKLKNYKSSINAQRKVERYTGTKKQAKLEKAKARNAYKNALDKYVNNEYDFQEKYNALLDDYKLARPGTIMHQDIREKIGILLENRDKERAKELHEARDSYEKTIEAGVKYGNAVHERNGKLGRTLVKGIEKATGLDTIEDIVTNYNRAQFKDSDDRSKQDKKLDTLSKIAKLEEELRRLTVKAKEEQERYANDNGYSTEEASQMFESNMTNTVKQSKKMNISNSYISDAVNSYLYENALTRISAENVDGVLDKIEAKLAKTGKKAKITDEVKRKVKQQLENKMIKNNEGLGFDSKDATVAIREALGKNGVLSPTKKFDIKDPVIKNLHEQILQKINEINTYNEVSKVKYKSSLVNINKIIADAKKGGK